MNRQRKNSPVSLSLVAMVSLGVLVAGGGAAWWAYKSLLTNDNPGVRVDPQPTISPSPIITEPPVENTTVQVYWLNSNGTQVDLAPTTVQVTAAEQGEVLTNTIKVLLAGPSDGEYTTTIPAETKLLNLSIKEDGIHLNLSEEFTFGGGSAGMTARLAQILYTSTVLDPEQAVWIDVEGQPLEFLGGEGVIVKQPMTRADFEQNFRLEAE